MTVTESLPAVAAARLRAEASRHPYPLLFATVSGARRMRNFPSVRVTQNVESPAVTRNSAAGGGRSVRADCLQLALASASTRLQEVVRRRDLRGNIVVGNIAKPVAAPEGRAKPTM